MDLPAGILGQFLAAHPQPPASQPERRHAARHAASTIVSIRRIRDGAPEAPAMAILRDISIQGASIVHSDPMAIGDRFHLVLPLNDKGVAIACSVARQYRLGAELFVTGATFDSLID